MMGLFKKKTKLAPEVIEKRSKCRHHWEPVNVHDVKTHKRGKYVTLEVSDNFRVEQRCHKCGATKGKELIEA